MAIHSGSGLEINGYGTAQVMVTDNDVIAWYNERFNKPGLFSGKRWPVTIDTSLTTGRYSWVWETGEEILDEYFKTFNVDPADFDFLKYWPDEESFLCALFSCGGDDEEPKPLTLRMLAESARAGKWLFN